MCSIRTLVLAIISIASAWVVVSASQTTPAPKVTGPIPVTAKPGDPSRNYPFFSTVQWLDQYAYMEEEFYIEGLANAYVVNGRSTGTVESGSPYPYKTRVIVRRPKSARAWTWSHEHMMRRGFVHVGASVQARDAESPNWLKKWNSPRYGALDITAGGRFATTAQLAFGNSGRAGHQKSFGHKLGGKWQEHLTSFIGVRFLYSSHACSSGFLHARPVKREKSRSVV